MTELKDLSVGQLQKVIYIKERIESLEAQLNEIAGTNSGTRSIAPAKTAGRRRMSASAKKRIGAAQKARWAKLRSGNELSAKEASAPKKRRKMSAAAKAKIAAAAKARWAKVKASGKESL